MYIKHSKPQFSQRDMWNLDNTLSQIIHSALVKFKSTIIDHLFAGVPMVMFDDNKWEHTEEETDIAFQKWLDTLDQMIYAFDISEQPDINKYAFTFDWESVMDEKGNMVMSNLKATDEAEYERYQRDEKEWQEKCEAGRLLFSKHFESLWV